jgi:hypothetical protein
VAFFVFSTAGFCFGVAPVAADWIAYDYWEMVCAIQWAAKGVPALIYVIIAFILCFLLPGVILVWAYYKVTNCLFWWVRKDQTEAI